jgi:hypothetical protein
MLRSSVMTWPPVRTAISCNILLRGTPKPDALTAATCNGPQSLFTTRAASTSLPTILCDYEQWPASLSNLLQQRKDVFLGIEFPFVNEDINVLERNFHAFGIVDEVG